MLRRLRLAADRSSVRLAVALRELPGAAGEGELRAVEVRQARIAAVPDRAVQDDHQDAQPPQELEEQGHPVHGDRPDHQGVQRGEETY